MSKKEKQELERTYGTFDAKGVIASIDEVVSEKSEKGNEYKSVKVHINTDKNSKIIIDFFGVKKSEVAITKFVGKGKVENSKTNWSARNNLENGWVLSNFESVRLGKKISDAKKKGGLSVFVAYDAIDEIANSFEAGMSVKVGGSISFSQYTNPKTSQTSVCVRYTGNMIYRIEDLDFEDENFEPHAKFNQDVILAGVEKDGDDVKLDCIIITDKNGGYVHQEFIINYNERPQFAKNIKKLKEYTFIPLKGDIVNIVIYDDAPTEDDGWGYDSSQQAIKGYERYFKTLVADATKIQEAKYTEDDFIIKDELEEIGNSVVIDDEVSPFENVDDGEDLSNDDEWL